MNEVMKMNPRNVNFSNECAFNSREYHFARRRNEVKLIYEAIAAGKIPGVKLDD
nr:MAG: hypothetical protein [Bacteriophage sp.]